MIVCWWSGGITSAVACQKAIELYGLDNCEFIFLDTFNEHEDTYRFKKDCEKWYCKEIKTLSAIPEIYKSIQDCWEKHQSLNVASGAVCSYKLKRVVREKWQKTADYEHQVFGFEFTPRELKRAIGLKTNHPKTKAIFPLLMLGLDKKDCIDIVQAEAIELPTSYKLGFSNNNCLRTGCVQGGVGYWQKMRRDFPDKFQAMADIEHKLTDSKGKPITMLRRKKQNVFLIPHPNYPELEKFDNLKGREPKPLTDCIGLCGTDDLLPKNKTEKEIAWESL